MASDDEPKTVLACRYCDRASVTLNAVHADPNDPEKKYRCGGECDRQLSADEVYEREAKCEPGLRGDSDASMLDSMSPDVALDGADAADAHTSEHDTNTDAHTRTEAYANTDTDADTDSPEVSTDD